MQVIPLSNLETGAFGANLKVIITHADLTETAVTTPQVIPLFNVLNKDMVQLVRAEVPTVFDASGDVDIITTTITVGDDGSANRLLTSTELNPSGTEVFQKGGALTNATAYVFTADNTVDATFATTSGKALSPHDSGEIHLYFIYTKYGNAG